MWHLGFDRSDYPGDDVMQSLFASTRMAFAGFYLAPAPSHPNPSWMTKLSTLRAQGWGIAPIFVGQQAPGGAGSHNLTAAQGVADAGAAVALGLAAGLEPGSVVYLDIEIGGQLGVAFLDYVKAWVNNMGPPAIYMPGVYCSFLQTAAQIRTQVGDVPTWAFHPIDSGPSTRNLADEVAPDPGDSGFAGALLWQYRMSRTGPITVTWKDINTDAARTLQTVDLDSCVALDPSNPTFPTPAVTSIDPPSGTSGDPVDIAGTDFDGVVDVAFAGASAESMNVTSDSQITAVVPDVPLGDVEVVVSNRFGLANTPGFPFTVT